MNAPRGLILGWYHKNNAGDDRIAHAFTRWLHDHELWFLPHTEVPPGELLDRIDYVIIGGGSLANQVHGVFKDMERWVRKANLPVYGVSLSISRFDRFQMEFSSIPRSGGLLWLRDSYSHQSLNSPVWAEVGPDITWLHPFDFAEKSMDAKNWYLNLRPWDKFSWSPRDLGQAVAQLNPNLKPLSFCFNARHPDNTPLSQIFPKEALPNDFNPCAFFDAELILAMRFHAIVFAIQSGTPFIALKNSKKLEEMLSSVGLDEFLLDMNDLSALPALSQRAIRELTPERLRTISLAEKEKAEALATRFKKHIEETVTLQKQKPQAFSRRVRRKLKSIL